MDHRLAVVRALRGSGGMSRSELVTELELSSTTMTKIAAELISAGYVVEGGEPVAQGVGRPRQALRIAPGALRILSISVEPQRLAWAEISLDLTIERAGSVAFDVASKPADATLARLALLVRDRMARAGQQGAIHGITLALPGFTDDELRVSIRAPHIHWQQVDVAGYLEDAAHLPVAIYNNARAMALAEFHHLRVDEGEPLLFVQTRQGIGAALVDTASTTSRHQVVTELGDIPLDGVAGARRGDSPRLHAVLNEQFLRDQLAFHDAGTEVMRHLEQAASSGKAAARRLRESTLDRLAFGLGIAVDLLNPRMVVLGGIFAHVSDAFLAELVEGIRTTAMSDLAERIDVRRSQLVGTGAQLGAQIAGVDRFFARGLF